MRRPQARARPAGRVLAPEGEFGKKLQPAVDLIQFRIGEIGPLAKILIVDDDSAVRATIRLLLERAGHSVVVADDGCKALVIVESGKFDLVFLDIFMPGMDGLETMKLVHQQQPLVPVIVISGNPAGAASGPDVLDTATKLGAVTTLRKPFKPAALLAAVAGCLETATAAPGRPDRAAGNVV
jgi:CheY-like chemotaxis protein